MSLFEHATFYTTVNHIGDLPAVRAEIAFAGRSNAGKSSAINTLTARTRLAFVSKTPGRTQHINFFSLADEVYLVDLPGYGYAQVPLAIRQHWMGLLGKYIATRQALIGLFLIMDARHPLKDSDKQMLDFVKNRGIAVHILLTKADKLSKNEQIKTLAKVRRAIKPWQEAMPVTLQLFSSLKKTGSDECDRIAREWLKTYVYDESQEASVAESDAESLS